MFVIFAKIDLAMKWLQNFSAGLAVFTRVTPQSFCNVRKAFAHLFCPQCLSVLIWSSEGLKTLCCCPTNQIQSATAFRRGEGLHTSDVWEDVGRGSGTENEKNNMRSRWTECCNEERPHLLLVEESRISRVQAYKSISCWGSRGWVAWVTCHHRKKTETHACITISISGIDMKQSVEWCSNAY